MGLISYLDQQTDTEALLCVLDTWDVSALFPCLLADVVAHMRDPAEFRGTGIRVEIRCLNTIWKWVSLDPSKISYRLYDFAISSLHNSPPSIAFHPAVVLMKLRWMDHTADLEDRESLLSALRHPIMAVESDTDIPGEAFGDSIDTELEADVQREIISDVFKLRKQARFRILVDLLGACSVRVPPKYAKETFRELDLDEKTSIHRCHQIRFANNMHNIMTLEEVTNDHQEIIAAVWSQLQHWDPFVSSYDDMRDLRFNWLNDPSARKLLTDSTVNYLTNLSSDHKLFPVLQQVVAKLNRPPPRLTEAIALGSADNIPLIHWERAPRGWRGADIS
ncbi:hypothetical protein C8J57DRAFT_1712844 [Mycena rebaudengoi]|nr:hypothetical protein C8J57DRAFT_1712844 [Mycena rebaudengoi]